MTISNPFSPMKMYEFRKGQINNITALVQIMAWRRPGDMPLSWSMMFSLQFCICHASDTGLLNRAQLAPFFSIIPWPFSCCYLILAMSLEPLSTLLSASPSVQTIWCPPEWLNPRLYPGDISVTTSNVNLRMIIRWYRDLPSDKH